MDPRTPFQVARITRYKAVVVEVDTVRLLEASKGLGIEMAPAAGDPAQERRSCRVHQPVLSVVEGDLRGGFVTARRANGMGRDSLSLLPGAGMNAAI